MSILKEQCNLGFTGKVNVLRKQNGQYVGEILILEGLIVAMSHDGTKGQTPLYKIILSDFEKSGQFKFVVEPEIVNENQVQFKITFAGLISELELKLQALKEMRTLRPPNHLGLKIRPEFVRKGPTLSLNEFEILCSLVDKRQVGDLYNSLPLLESEITKNLVTLRKKKAFIVTNN